MSHRATEGSGKNKAVVLLRARAAPSFLPQKNGLTSRARARVFHQKKGEKKGVFLRPSFSVTKIRKNARFLRIKQTDIPPQITFDFQTQTRADT